MSSRTTKRDREDCDIACPVTHEPTSEYALPSAVPWQSHILYADTSTLKLFVNSFVAVTVLLAYITAHLSPRRSTLMTPLRARRLETSRSQSVAPFMSTSTIRRKCRTSLCGNAIRMRRGSACTATFAVSLELNVSSVAGIGHWQGDVPFCSLATLPTKVRLDGDDVNTSRGCMLRSQAELVRNRIVIKLILRIHSVYCKYINKVASVHPLLRINE
jgi:hypothetical protein